MDVVFALVGVSIVLVILIAIVLIWAVRSGQFEDMEGPAWRVIMDDDRPSTGDAPDSEPEIEPPGSLPPDASREATLDTRREVPNVKTHEHE
jgi:cbb3-type cytochrome oxidase maturation protein